MSEIGDIVAVQYFWMHGESGLKIADPHPPPVGLLTVRS